MSETKKAAIYVRVSTEMQTEGYSIDEQKELLTAYCVSKNIKNFEYYIDGGWTGSDIARPEMQRMIEDIKKDKISHCIIYKLDRLSRSQRDTLYLIEDVFNMHNVAFVSLTESLDTSTPMGRCVIGILSAFAQLERENIRMRTRMGMNGRVKQGYWMGGGRIPFGYDYDKNQGILVPNKDADTVRRIYDLYIKGYSAQQIANILGLKYDRLCIQILKRKSNYGIIEYNGEEYTGKHEPIISKETYDRAMDAMLKRSVNSVTTSEHLLTGLVYCGKCGAKMRYQNWGKSGSKFVCYSQQTSKPYLIKDRNCDQQKLWCDEVESFVLDKIFLLRENDDMKATETQDSQESVLTTLNTLRIETERKIKRLYNLYSTAEDELLLTTINEQKKNLEKINKQILRENKQMDLLSGKKSVEVALDSLQEKWAFMTQKEKQAVIRILINKITITDSHISIVLNI